MPPLRLFRGLSAWLAFDRGEGAAVHREEELEAKTRAVRQAMVASLGGARCEMSQRLAMRIHFAPDLLDLWYLRADLLRALTRLHDQQRAGEMVEPITGMFRGFVPAAAWRTGRYPAFH